ncbi:MAG: GNAT family acetyltransferase [Candidatus Bipolaricaulota bacterium]|nr:MAG: GNAT family acetyltransferase [Candidatus Bipolaricaulota bacterium]
MWRACGLVVPWNDPHRDVARKLAAGVEGFLVGLLDGVIIAAGMAGYDGHRGWINYLAVHPNHRRKGFGRQLMDAAEALLRSQGCPKINLQVRGTNADAIGFYEHIGFVRDDVTSLGKRLEPDT